MTNADLLRRIRNDLPMPVTIAALGREGPPAKISDGYYRFVCPGCGEQDKDSLPIYTASDFDHVRVDACDRCKTYIKSVDLTRNGHAIPVVDELATVALNIWAENQGYSKLEANLLGL